MKWKRIIRWLFSLYNKADGKCVVVCGKPIFTINRYKKVNEMSLQTPIKKDKIVINNYRGLNLYGCHAKYIIEEIFKRNLPYEIVWLLRDIEKADTSCFPPGIRLVDYQSEEAIKELAEANVIVANATVSDFIKRGWRKKPEQYYLQTWHGSLGIKRNGGDANNRYDPSKGFGLSLAETDAAYIDVLISNSTFEDEMYRSVYHRTDDIIMKVGHARNDIFFEGEETYARIKQKVAETYGVIGKKFVLYVPTFRDDFSIDCYGLEVDRLLDALNKRFGGEFVLLTRMHPYLKGKDKDLFKANGTVVNTTEYPDIQELLVASDVVITDYSSCIFDYMLGRRPGFVFATDLDKYNTERGFYYPLEETPFPIAQNNDEIIDNILSFDDAHYQKEIDRFLADRGCIERGDATVKVVDLIEKVMSGKNK